MKNSLFVLATLLSSTTFAGTYLDKLTALMESSGATSASNGYTLEGTWRGSTSCELNLIRDGEFTLIQLVQQDARDSGGRLVEGAGIYFLLQETPNLPAGAAEAEIEEVRESSSRLYLKRFFDRAVLRPYPGEGRFRFAQFVTRELEMKFDGETKALSKVRIKGYGQEEFRRDVSCSFGN